MNRQIRQRAEGRKVTRLLGRPKKKVPEGQKRVSHETRPVLSENSALHITLRASERVPNLRARRRYNVIKAAFVKFAKGRGFRLVHFAVLSNHVHFIVEADGRRALAMGLQKLLHSISRRLNALNVVEHGGRVSTKGGAYSAMHGWIGRVFSDRYHAHALTTPTEMARAVRYVLTNAERHYGTRGDSFSSAAEPQLVVDAKGYLLARASKRALAPP